MTEKRQKQRSVSQSQSGPSPTTPLVDPRPPAFSSTASSNMLPGTLDLYDQEQAETSVIRNGRQILGRIGKGSFGRVYAAQNIKTGQPEALKVVPKSQAALREVRTHKFLLNHSNIVQLLEVFCSKHSVFMYLTYGGSRNLYHCITHQMYSFDGSLDIFAEIADAVFFMHGLGVCHLDIKPENVLIDDYDVPRIADFGSAGRTNALITYSAGSFPFAAPEVLVKMSMDNAVDRNSRQLGYSRPLGYHGDLADVFSMGIMLLEMVQGSDYVMYQLGWAGKGHSVLMQDPLACAVEMMNLLRDGTRLSFLRWPLPGGFQVPEEVVLALDFMLQPEAARRQLEPAACLVLFP